MLSLANGSLYPNVMFVAEAPGRLGADRSLVPLCGDQTGRNFEYFLQSIGWMRSEVFITNAVLCNPRDNRANNRNPNLEEVRSCSRFLRRLIGLLDPTVVVTLGRVALKALLYVAPHSCQLPGALARPARWERRFLFPLYHPSPRALIRRSKQEQLGDYQRLADFAAMATGHAPATAL